MRAVNLLPPERRRRGGAQTFALTALSGQSLLLAVAGIVVATVLGVGLWTHSAGSGLADKEDQLASLQAELAMVNRQQSKSVDTAGAARRLNEVVSLASGRMPWDAFLGGFARVVPEDVWLLSLEAAPAGATATPVSASTPAGATPPPTTPLASTTPFTISGYTYSQASVARLIDRLTLIPWLSDVQLQNSTLTQLENRFIYQFSIGASMVNSGEEVAS